MKILYILILIVVLTACKADYFQIVNKRLSINLPKRNKTFESFYHVREKVYKSGFLSFVTEKDTTFLLEDYDISSATFYCSVWTKNKSFHYSFSDDLINEIIINKTNNERGNVIFDLISKWDTTAIRKESNINYNKFNPSHEVLAYRVYKPAKIIIIDKIKFRPFY